jgi:hypothetical protein
MSFDRRKCFLALLLVCAAGRAQPVDLESLDWRDLPLNSRHYLDLIRSTTEVTSGQEGGNIEGYGPYSPRGNSGLNSLGQRGQNNNFLVDGMDNNESWLRGAVLEPSIEAIETVNLTAVYVPSELGHAAGAVVSVRTRSGSSQFHGSLFDYSQNSALKARNFFDGAEKPGLVQNQFGGSLGGPLRKNDWFLFLSSELSRERRGLTVISTVPSAAQKAGSFGTVPIYDPLTITQVGPIEFVRQPLAGNRIPPSSISQAARNLVALYPDPNLAGSANNYRFTPFLIRNSNRFNLRSDKDLPARGKLFARLSYGRQNAESPSALPGAVASDTTQHADGADTNLTTWGGVISHTTTVRPSLANEFRAGIARFDLTAYSRDRGLDASAALAIPGLSSEGLPVVRPTGYAQLGAAGPAPMQIRNTNYQVEDTVLWTTARHAWKFGFQAIRRHVDGTASEWTSRGTFFFTPDYTSQQGVDGTGNSMASLMLGYPSEIRRDVQFEPFRLRGWEWAGFVHDEIRIGRRLTIQAGVRYSLYPPLTEAMDRLVNFNSSRQTPALDQFAGNGGVNKYAGLRSNERIFAPRIGFALDLWGNGSTVLRGGFSQTYDTGSYIAEGSLARNPPFAARQDIFNGSLQLGPNLSEGVPAPERAALLDADSLNRVRGAIYAIEARSYTPYSDQWGLFVQQRLRPELILEIGGMSSMGMHLHTIYNTNQPYPAPTPYSWRRHPYAPYLSRVEYLGFAGGSTYYGGQIKLTGKLGPNLRLLASYVYAKSLDDATAPGTDQQSRPSGPQYIYELHGVRSPSPFDVTQRFKLAAFYELPFRSWRALVNWRLSALVTVRGGLPFTPELAINGLNNGGIQLPDRVGDGSLPSNQRSPLRWFNTSFDKADPNHAFETPPVFQYGNSGFDILRGPGLATVDAALARSFSLGKRLRLIARAEAFNLLNRTNLALPNRILGLDSSGVISHTSTPARQIQMAARLEW